MLPILPQKNSVLWLSRNSALVKSYCEGLASEEPWPRLNSQCLAMVHLKLVLSEPPLAHIPVIFKALRCSQRNIGLSHTQPAAHAGSFVESKRPNHGADATLVHPFVGLLVVSIATAPFFRALEKEIHRKKSQTLLLCTGKQGEQHQNMSMCAHVCVLELCHEILDF